MKTAPGTLARVAAMPFARVYPLYLAKAERKGRTRAEVETILEWLTGYGPSDLARHCAAETDLAAFFQQAPRLNPARTAVRGVVCGVRVEEIAEPLLREVRCLDKLIDELARGKPLAKILRA
jgi:hypothetical protein